MPALTKRNFGLWLVLVFVPTITAFQLHHQGRLWWCACGSRFLWTGNAWGSLTSQALFDPYSFTHILHGLMICGLLSLLIRGLPAGWRFGLAIIIESAWELVENTH